MNKIMWINSQLICWIRTNPCQISVPVEIMWINSHTILTKYQSLSRNGSFIWLRVRTFSAKKRGLGICRCIESLKGLIRKIWSPLSSHFQTMRFPLRFKRRRMNAELIFFSWNTARSFQFFFTPPPTSIEKVLDYKTSYTFRAKKTTLIDVSELHRILRSTDS